jgi:two-component system OmpR family response regulator
VRILCADDEPDIRLVLEIALGLDPAITAEVVDSGVAVIERATRDHYDLIVLDGSMPELDGYDTCARLKSDPRTAHVPVVFLTANTQRVQRERALGVGAIAAITKPFDPMTLAAELRQLSGIASP